MKPITVERLEAFYRFYKRAADVTVGSLGFSLLVAILSISELIPPIVFHVVLGIVVTILFFVWVVMVSSRAYYEASISRGNIRVEKQIWKWLIKDRDGSLSTDVFYEIRNKSGRSVSELVPEREGFSEPISNLEVLVKKVGGSPISIVQVLGQPQSFARTITVSPGVHLQVQIWQWALGFSPPLKNGESILFARSYDVVSTEKMAFSEQGTYAGFAVYYPTKYLEANLIAPPHTKLELLEHMIVTQTGEADHREMKRNLPPTVEVCRSMIRWKIFYPKIHLRYVIAYRIS